MNDNVEKYYEIISQNEMHKVNADAATDRDLSLQLTEYFQQELPALFWEREAEHDAKYVVNKAGFVDNLIRGKIQYTETLLNFVKQFRAIMDDISSNYNVNFQDSGVKAAVESYQNYLGKYDDLLDLKKLEIPKNFSNELEKLRTLVKKSAQTLLSSDADDDKLQLEDDQQMKFESSKLSTIKRQVSTHENEVAKLENKLTVKNNELNSLEESMASKNNDVEDKKHQLLMARISNLLEEMGDTKIIQEELDNYLYEITANPKTPGSIYQIETKNDGNIVKIGSLQRISLNKEDNLQKYVEHLKMLFPKEDLVSHLISETESETGDRKYLFGNLANINNGVVLEYGEGHRCWNGPQRSAQLFIKCGEKFKLHNVYEATKCRYVFDASGPLGCSESFKYLPISDDWVKNPQA